MLDLSEADPALSWEPQVVPAHVVLLTSYVPPHQAPSYMAWSRRMRKLTVLVSTKMEQHRNWHVDWGTLDVEVQRNLTIRRPWKHAAGFTENISVHIPWDTSQRLRKLNPDVVISGELGIRSLLSALYAKWHPSVLFVLWACVSEHTEQGRGWLRNLLRKWLVRQADLLIVNGASGRRYVRQLGCPDELIHEIPYTCPSEAFEKCPTTREDSAAHRLIFVGQLAERKGIGLFLPVLISWAQRNPQRTVELRIVGSGPLEEKLKKIPLPENLQLVFAGWRTYDQLPEEYAQAGILVFPTLADEWGLVVNEAMSAGLPVLGSLYSASVEELCTPGETGWIFRPDHPQEMYDAVEQALNASPEDLNQMRLICRERMKQTTTEDCADYLAGILRAELARRKGAGRE